MQIAGHIHRIRFPDMHFSVAVTSTITLQCLLKFKRWLAIHLNNISVVQWNLFNRFWSNALLKFIAYNILTTCYLELITYFLIIPLSSREFNLTTWLFLFSSFGYIISENLITNIFTKKIKNLELLSLLIGFTCLVIHYILYMKTYTCINYVKLFVSE